MENKKIDKKFNWGVTLVFTKYENKGGGINE